MRLLEAILKLAVQLFTFFVTLAVRIISAIVGALWQAWLNRSPRHAMQSPPARGSRPHAKLHNQRRRRKHGHRRQRA